VETFVFFVNPKVSYWSNDFIDGFLIPQDCKKEGFLKD
jgi:hypothetical protein